MYNVPYGDTQQLNLDWFIKRWKEFYAQWEAAEAGIDGALDAEIEKVENAMQDLYAARDAAAASATAAAASASSADEDATIAANAAIAAAASATLANNKAAAAGLSEANAAQSATSAGNSASAAATSASQANASESAATASAQAASASETAATASAQAASASETAAAGSASDAADSAQRAEDAAAAAQAGGIVKSVENVPIASVNDALAANVVELVVDIEPVQAGTGDPSPDNVRLITGRTSANVMNTGVNLWDGVWESGDINNTTGQNSINSTQWRTVNYIPILPNTEYYVGSHVSDEQALRARFYDKDKNYIGYSPKSGAVSTHRTFISPDNAYYLRFAPYNNTIPDHDVSINYPSTDTGYYTYLGTTIAIIFPTEAGIVYGGILTNQGADVWKLRLDKAFYEAQDVPWTMSVNTVGLFLTNMSSSQPDAKSHNNGGRNICSHYRTSTSFGAEGIYQNTERQCMIRQTVLSTIEEWNAFITAQKNANTPVQIIYSLATPIEYTITESQALILLNGINNVWSDSGNINLLQYYTDSKKYIDEQDTLIKALIAPVLDNMIADTALIANDFRIVENTLYKITAPVAAGATLTPNTNCAATTIGEVLKTLLT